MSFGESPIRSNEPDTVYHDILIQGNATVANASIVAGSGEGWSLSYSGTGLYTLTPSDNPGKLVGFTFGFQASTQANLAGHSAVADDKVSVTNAIPVQVFNATPAAHALVADEYISVTLKFRTSSA